MEDCLNREFSQISQITRILGFLCGKVFSRALGFTSFNPSNGYHLSK